MTDTANATGPKTPPPGGDPATEIKSTPNTNGTAIISENIATVGTGVNELRPWINRDIKDYKTCTIDEMLQELLYHCRVGSNSDSDSEEEFEQESEQESQKKKELLKELFDSILSNCDGPMKKMMKGCLSEFVNSPTESSSYKHFVQAANHALLRLSKLKVPGLTKSNDENERDILFHWNDMPISQDHQGKTSQRKPDVVVVSCKTALGVLEDPVDTSKKKPIISSPSKHKLMSDYACKQPRGRFGWSDVLSTFEFKRTPNHNMEPPDYDELDISDAPTKQHYRGAQPVKPTHLRPASIPAGRAVNEPRRSERLGSSQGGNKRPSDSQVSSERDSKRVKSNDEEPNDENIKVAMKTTETMEQNGLYAAEMFAANVARQHVLSCVVNNDMIYLWHFDRQNAIQCSGFNFIHDLPRFLALLFIMQRMPYAQWGYNRLFDPEPGTTTTIEVDDKTGTTVDLEFEFRSPDRTTHYGLRGRATNVYPVKSTALSRLARQRPSRNNTDELVAKIYWPEESRQSEAEILEEVQKIAAESPEVKDHVPDVIWSHKFEDTSTAKVRKALGITDAESGSRALYIIVFRKLRPITELSGDKFLRAWWHAVNCHRVLWERGVRHRDVSPSNLMFYYDSSGEIVGVLNDYDLSSLKTVPSGRERTGTVPFMAIDLLGKKALEGKVEHLYQHDAESFIWVLTWVCLRYDDGKLRSASNDRPLDDWLTVDATGCREKKNNFLNSARYEIEPSPSHESNWLVAKSCLRTLSILYGDLRPSLPVEDVFKTWFEDVVPKSL